MDFDYGMAPGVQKTFVKRYRANLARALEMLGGVDTAENMARFFYDRLRAQGFLVAQVQVYETPTNCACYTGEEKAAALVQL